MRAAKEWELRNMLINCELNDVLHHLNQAEYGDHSMIVYPDLDTLRELYSNYALKQIKENNEIVLINPSYETADSVDAYFLKNLMMTSVMYPIMKKKNRL